jgi:tetratricopeptide (TPR) repeat protein
MVHYDASWIEVCRGTAAMTVVDGGTAASLGLFAVSTLAAAGVAVAVLAYRRAAGNSVGLKLRRAGARPDAVRRDVVRMIKHSGVLGRAEADVSQPFEVGRTAMAAFQWNRAIDHFRLAQASASRAQLVPLANLVGICHYFQGRLSNALREFRESDRLAEHQQDRKGRAAALNNVGVVRYEYGELDGALDQLGKALACARESGSERLVATCLGNSGSVQRERGDLDEALKSHRAALAMSLRAKDKMGAVSAAANAASVHRDKGELDKAIEFYTEAGRSAREIGDGHGHSIVLGGIAGVHHDRGDFKRALRFHQEALGEARRIGFRLGTATELANVGLMQEEKGTPALAVPSLLEALSILKTAGVDRGEPEILHGLSRCDDALGRKQMQELFRQAGLTDEDSAKVLDRVDQLRRRRPRSAKR